MNNDPQDNRDKLIKNNEAFDETIISSKKLANKYARVDEIKFAFDFIRNTGFCIGIAYAAYLLFLRYEFLNTSTGSEPHLSKYLIFGSAIIMGINALILFMANCWSFMVQSKRQSEYNKMHSLRIAVFILVVFTSSAVVFLFKQ